MFTQREKTANAVAEGQETTTDTKMSVRACGPLQD